MDPSQILHYPHVNGAECSFCSIEFKVGGGIKLPGCKSINYKDPLEFGKIWGTSPQKQGATRGKLDPSGDIEIYRSQFTALMEVLTRGGTVGYADLRWPITIVYAEVGAMVTTEDFLSAVRFHSADHTNAEGVEATTVKLQMDPMQVVYGGLGSPRVQLSSNPIITGVMPA